jgi:hypothetical protein
MGAPDIGLIEFKFARPVLSHRTYAFGSLHLPD